MATPMGGGGAAGAGGDPIVDAGQPGAAGVGGDAGGTAGSAGGAAAGAGGTQSGGRGGSSAGGAGGVGGGGDVPMPSAGCGRAIAKPERTVVLANHEVTRLFPASYDGVTPMPLVMAFHATSANNVMAQMLAKDQPAAERYVVLAPAAGSPSTFEALRAEDLASLLGEALAELCVDQRLLFGVGNGSGGRFLLSWRTTCPAVPSGCVFPRWGW